MQYDDTFVHQRRNPNDTSYDGNSGFGLSPAAPIPVYESSFNRAVRRYAKKHRITLKEAAKKLYK